MTSKQATKKRLRKEVQYFTDYAFDIPGCTTEDRRAKSIEFDGQTYWFPALEIEKDGFCPRCGAYHFKVFFGRILYTGQAQSAEDGGYFDGFADDDDPIIYLGKNEADPIHAPINKEDQDYDYATPVYADLEAD